jgi:hypothetical protein
MTMLQCISSFSFMIFSQNMRQHSSPSLLTHQTLHQQTSFSSPSWNPYWKDDNLSLLRRLKKIPCRATHYSTRGIPEMRPKLEETLRALYKKWRRVLRGEQSPVAPK